MFIYKKTITLAVESTYKGEHL